MKLILSCTVVLIVILTGISSQAQVPPLTLYDNFESKYFDPEKWVPVSSITTGGNVLDIARQIKTEPISGKKALYFLYRGYGDTGSDTGAPRLINRMTFPNGGNITTIQSKVMVKKVEAGKCLTPTADDTDVEARIGGFFFNTGTGTPTPGDATGDVFASIALRRLSSSTSKPTALEVVGSAFHCSNAGCTAGSDVGTEQILGTVSTGEWVKLRITWDQAGHFIFQKGKSPEVSLSYGPLSDTSPPGAEDGGLKRLDIYELVANCTSLPRPVGHIEVYFDDVSIN